MMNDLLLPRRGLLGAAAALGTAAAFPQAVRADATAPKQGGHFRIGVADFATSDGLDPAAVDTQFQVNLEWQLRNNLAEVAPGGKVVPELAESWEASKDARPGPSSCVAACSSIAVRP